jgi:histidine ammonia-lyase
MTIKLNGSDLTVTQVVAAARHGEAVVLAPGQLGLGTGRAFRMIRELVPFTQTDGALPADLEPLVELVSRGDLTPAA